MSENEQGTFKPQFGAELNIESIIGAPLVAASKANVMMLTGQAQFLLDYCFTKEEGSDLRQPLMIEMVLSQPVVDHTKQPTDPGYISINKMAFQVPLLCLLPLNSLAIDKINVDFDLEITSVGSYDYKSQTNPENRKTTASKKRQKLLQITIALCRNLFSKFQLNQSENGIINHIHIIGVYTF